ncbi:MAG: toxin TcdB middle/N-terminal domain-containing protein [Chloroflexota bacterium]
MKHPIIYQSILLLLWLCFFMANPTVTFAQDKSGVTPQVISLPSGPGSLEGLGESFEPNLSTGTSSYPVKFTAAPGRVGFQPQLSLSYNGGNANGPWGMGWGLSIPSIQRRTDDGLPTYDDAKDTFIHSSGEKLIRLNNSDYRFENESSFMRFRRLGDGWEAHTPGGIRYLFGETSNGRVTNPQGIFRWELERMIDTNGNEMQYIYLHDGNYAYPHEIRYNFGEISTGEEIYNAVVFNYEPRPDTFTDRRSGAPIRVGLRGTNIEMWSLGTLVRAYQFEYEAERSTGTYSLLVTVFQVGDDGVSTLPPHTFTYTQFDPLAHAVVPMQSPPPVVLTNLDVDLVDINADGLPDLVYTPEDGHHRFYLNKGHARWETQPVIPDNSPAERLSNPNVRMADMNGDGRVDLLVKASAAGNNPLYYYRNQPGADWEIEDRVDFGPSPAFDLNDPNLQLMDVNNDRSVDVVLTTGQRMKIWLARDDAWSQEADFDVPAPAAGDAASFDDPKFKIGDMTGDRIDDIVMVRDGQVVLWEHNGNGSYEEPRAILNPPTNVGNQDIQIRMGDLNNDGQMDLVLPSNRTVVYWLSLGNGSLTDPIVIPNTPEFDAQDTAIRLTDIDGDGATELLFSSNQGMSYVDFSTQEQPFLLRSVDNGLGRTIHITYKSSIEDYIADWDAGNPWEINLPFPVQVVNQVTVHDANSGDDYTIDYHYRDGYYNGEEKEFRGFVRSQEIKVGDETAATTITNLRYDVGMVDEAHKGMLLESEVLAVGGQCSGDFGGCFLRTINQVETRIVVEATETESGEPIAYAFVKQTDSFIHEQQAEPVQLRQQFKRDAYGNETEQFNYGMVCADGTEMGDVACGNDEVLTYTDFIYDPERHIFNRAMRIRQTDLAGNFVSEINKYYDGEPFLGLPHGQLTAGNVSREESSLGPAGDNRFIPIQRNEYDQYGNIITMMDANSHKTTIEYDSIQHTFPVMERAHLDGGRTLVYAASYHHGFGKMMAATDYNGNAHRFTYNTFGHISKIVKPGDTLEKPSQAFFYHHGSPRSWIKTELRQAAGSDDVITSITYFDGLGRQLQMRSEATGGQVVVENAVDFNARRTIYRQYLSYYADSFDYAAPEPTLPHTALHYDPMGRAVRAINPDGSFNSVTHGPLMELAYDEEDNRSDSPHYSTPTTSIYDGLQRLIRLEEANIVDGQPVTYKTHYEYDLQGNITKITDSHGNVRTMTYDGLARRLTMSDPNRGTWRYAYDDVSNLIRIDDAVGQSLHYTYDAVNRPVMERWEFTNGREPVVNAIFHYDDDKAPAHQDAQNTMGMITYVEDQAGATYFSYDPRGNPIGSIRHFKEEGINLVTRSEYDSMDRLIKTTFADGSSVSYERNARGQLTRIPGFVDEITYLASDQRHSIRYANGVETTYGYDQRLRLAHLNTTGSQATLQDLRYTFDGTSNVLSITDGRPQRTAANDLSQTFTYDALYRLTEVTGSYGEIEFGYDAIGNMISKISTVSDPRLNIGTMTYGSVNGSTLNDSSVNNGSNAGPHALVTAGQFSYQYDNNGNVVHRAMENPTGDTSPGDISYQWDARNRLAATDDGTTYTTYQYNAGFQRVRQTVRQGDVVTRTLYAGSSIEVRGDELVFYIYDNQQRIARITMPHDPARLLSGFSDEPSLIPPQSIERVWFVADYLGSTGLLVNEAGEMVSEIGYYPYGLTRYEQGENQAYYQFTGKELDTNGLHYFESRYYDASIGNFISADYHYHDKPEAGLADPQLLNLYAYARNNPAKYTDPSGMSPDDSTGATEVDENFEKGAEMIFDAGSKALDGTPVGTGMGGLASAISLGANLRTVTDPKASSMDKVEASHGIAGAIFGIGEAGATALGATKTAAAFSSGGLLTTVTAPLIMYAKGIHDAKEGALKNNRRTGRQNFANGEAAALMGLSLHETMERFGFQGTAPNRNMYETMKAANESLEKGWRKVSQYSEPTKVMIVEHLAQKAAQNGGRAFRNRGWNGTSRDIEPLVRGYGDIIRQTYGSAVHAK